MGLLLNLEQECTGTPKTKNDEFLKRTNNVLCAHNWILVH